MKPAQLKATLRIGKGGLTDTVVQELRRQLAKQKTVKAKLLTSAREGSDVKAMAKDLALRASARLVDVRGGTAVFSIQAAPRRGVG